MTAYRWQVGFALGIVIPVTLYALAGAFMLMRMEEPIIDPVGVFLVFAVLGMTILGAISGIRWLRWGPVAGGGILSADVIVEGYFRDMIPPLVRADVMFALGVLLLGCLMYYNYPRAVSHHPGMQ